MDEKAKLALNDAELPDPHNPCTHTPRCDGATDSHCEFCDEARRFWHKRDEELPEATSAFRGKK